ncbi:type II toxin-antitoxin system VapC family toxin [Methylocystis echinoides]|uniref:PIN domain nuclease n=1 Tax=Methylocystis echinoides TaxID=29468 RepID=A0A9W6GTF9_9HYPH|nr:type II toxin-antitoxin system VapC family toxin [Methylocystis echinoides]GLI92772.1 PIN domain nuclease [Methylocystis echinoides]
MGIRNALRGRRVYFDTNVFIYLLEGFPSFDSELQDIRDCILHAEAAISTSELTICEALVKPFRANDSRLLVTYRQFIEESGAFAVLPTHRDIYVRAGLYRAQFGLKTPDAIHVATAVDAKCGVFLSNDKNLKVPHGLQIMSLGGAPA